MASNDEVVRKLQAAATTVAAADDSRCCMVLPQLPQLRLLVVWRLRSAAVATSVRPATTRTTRRLDDAASILVRRLLVGARLAQRLPDGL